MNYNKIYNYTIVLIIALVAVYLFLIFLKIDYNPNYVRKGHHDFSFKGYLKFFIYLIGWFFFLMGVFQLKEYLLGQNKLLLISVLYIIIISYVLFLFSVTYGFNETSLKTGAFFKAASLIISSFIVLLFSWTKYATELHERSKNNFLKK